jgi:hypothetical protein
VYRRAARDELDPQGRASWRDPIMSSMARTRGPSPMVGRDRLRPERAVGGAFNRRPADPCRRASGGCGRSFSGSRAIEVAVARKGHSRPSYALLPGEVTGEEVVPTSPGSVVGVSAPLDLPGFSSKRRHSPARLRPRRDRRSTREESRRYSKRRAPAGRPLKGLSGHCPTPVRLVPERAGIPNSRYGATASFFETASTAAGEASGLPGTSIPSPAAGKQVKRWFPPEPAARPPGA